MSSVEFLEILIILVVLGQCIFCLSSPNLELLAGKRAAAGDASWRHAKGRAPVAIETPETERGCYGVNTTFSARPSSAALTPSSTLSRGRTWVTSLCPGIRPLASICSDIRK